MQENQQKYSGKVWQGTESDFFFISVIMSNCMTDYLNLRKDSAQGTVGHISSDFEKRT